MQSTDHPQDELLIVEALIQLGKDLHETNAVRAARARRLARDIAAEHGLDVGDALFQIETTADSPEATLCDHINRRSQSTDDG